MTETIKTENLTKEFGTLRAVNDLCLTAEKGEVIALLGPNGAGKSTLMNMLSGYITPTSGKIRILGKYLSDDPLAAKAGIGFLPEGSPLYPDMSVRRFLRYMAELKNFRGKLMEDEILRVAELARIKEVLSQKIENLSKGYQRRVGFAQSLLGNPPILLLDEPTDGLDPNQKDHIRELICRLSKEKTILISTHLLEEAETICGKIILIDRGLIKADGSLADILAQTRTSDLASAFKKLTKGIKTDV